MSALFAHWLLNTWPRVRAVAFRIWQCVLAGALIFLAVFTVYEFVTNGAADARHMLGNVAAGTVLVVLAAGLVPLVVFGMLLLGGMAWYVGRMIAILLWAPVRGPVLRLVRRSS